MKKLLVILIVFGITLTSFTNPGILKNEISYQADPTISEIKWNGKKVTGEHYGKISLSSGNLFFDSNNLLGGEFVIDMVSITCDDLTDAGTNAKLVKHLKSDDFFSVEKHPKATFVITSAEAKAKDIQQLTGDLTIKGITNEITFPATVQAKDNKLEANAQIVVDRSKFDVRYGSGSFFENLGNKMIYDDFTLDVKIVAEQIEKEI
jgi:polyisoprenoid-binding protein YceI